MKKKIIHYEKKDICNVHRNQSYIFLLKEYIIILRSLIFF